VRYLRAHPVYLLKDRLNTGRVIIHTDGAARGNPGPAAIGATIRDEAGQIQARLSCRIGVTTNNQAEYHAVIAALKKAVSLGARHVTLKADSELLVQQINGRFKVKNTTLRRLYLEVVQLTGSLESFTITYIPRTVNAEADALANKALDST
jgi:ribonuclease HI